MRTLERDAVAFLFFFHKQKAAYYNVVTCDILIMKGVIYMQQIRVSKLKTRNQGGTVVITVPKSSGIEANQIFDFTKKEDGTLIYSPVKEENFWDSLNNELSDEEIDKMHQDAIKDLGYNPSNVKPVGNERWWLNE